MAADVKIDIAAEFTGAKAFKKAETALNRLNNNAKSLAKTLGLTFGAAAIANYGKNAVKAFAADDKAAKGLSLTLKNLGLQFADPATKAFISDLESQYGVLDDQLRPAFQKLITTTRDFASAQKLMMTALDLSAMSGLDIESVVSDLSKAYSGNTKGLQKYGLGIDKATLATMSFDDILKVIANVSVGQAQEAANSYSGALDRLNVAVANASESIGKDLVNAFTTLGGSGGLPKSLSLIESFSSGIGDALIGISRLIEQANIITSSGNPIEMFRRLAAFKKEYQAADAKERKDAEIAARRYGGIYADIYNQQKKILVDKKSITALELKALQAARLKAAMDKANLALGKGTDVFDMEKIQLQAAEINQAQQLGKVTSQAQLLQITNDLARLQTKKDIIALEEAIALGDVKAIEAATAKLNGDLKILGALTNQELKLKDIKSILDEIAPKDLINIENLNNAIDLLGKISLPSLGASAIAALSPAEVDAILANEPSSVATKLTPAQISGQRYAAQGQAQMDAYLAQVAAGLGGMAGSSFAQGTAAGLPVSQALSGARYAAQGAAAAGISVTVNAGTIANPDELTTLIQNSLISLNKRGDLTSTAGSL